MGGAKTPGAPPRARPIPITKLTATLSPIARRQRRVQQATVPLSNVTLDPNDKAKINPDAAKLTKQSPTDNPPVVLIRGGGLIELQSDAPDGQDVKWEILTNPKRSGDTPVLEPDGTKARLKTDKSGSFSVKATSGGVSLFWNVALIDVKVAPPPTSRVRVRGPEVFAQRDNDSDKDSSGNPTDLVFQAGNFPPKHQGAFGDMLQDFGRIDDARSIAGMRAELHVELACEGADPSVFQKVILRPLQNGTDNSITGFYDGAGEGREVAHGGIPILDANRQSKTNGHESFVDGEFTEDWQGPFVDDAHNNQEPFMFLAPSSLKIEQVQSGNFAKWIIHTLDAPEGGFPRLHKNTGRLLRGIGGRTVFRTALASISKDARNMIVVHADFVWRIQWDAAVTYPGFLGIERAVNAKYDGSKSRVVLDRDITMISPATGGAPASTQGFELFPPIFLGEDNSDIVFTP